MSLRLFKISSTNAYNKNDLGRDKYNTSKYMKEWMVNTFQADLWSFIIS